MPDSEPVVFGGAKSRGRVFWETTRELFCGFAPRVLGISLVVFGAARVLAIGFVPRAFIDTVVLTTAMMFGLLMICAGVGLQAALIWYRRRPGKRPEQSGD